MVKLLKYVFTTFEIVASAFLLEKKLVIKTGIHLTYRQPKMKLTILIGICLLSF